jgi:hypothetical protein
VGGYGVLVGKPEGKGSRRSYDDNIKTDRQKVGWGVMDRIDLSQNTDTWWALVKTVMNLRDP